MIFFDEDLFLFQCHRNFLLSYLSENGKRKLFMSNLYIIIFGKRQAAALHEQLVRYRHRKTTSGSSSRAACALLLFLENDKRRSLHEQLVHYYFWKTTSGGLFMSNLYVIDIVRKRQAAVSLFEQLVRYYLIGKRQAAVSLFE